MTGVAGDVHAIGFFGYAYFVENKDKLKAVEVDGGSGCVAPTEATINDNSYAPLSRPLFIYPDVGKAEDAAGAEGVRGLLPREHRRPSRPRSATSPSPTTAPGRRRTPGRPPSAADRAPPSCHRRAGPTLGSGRRV